LKKKQKCNFVSDGIRTCDDPQDVWKICHPAGRWDFLLLSWTPSI
jgi:hypothetical protein